ncbi:MAG: hypothetical protein JNK02_02290 [Planctomycetes bacterium]|nr:hypothetical protein [Planctomycetota bacterium]
MFTMVLIAGSGAAFAADLETIGQTGPICALSHHGQHAIDQGLTALSILDPAAHAAILHDLAIGGLQIGELQSTTRKAESDVNTIAIKLSDNPTAVQVAARLAHEQHHRANDYVGRPYFHDTEACKEARAWAHTYETLRAGSCLGPSEGVGGVPCSALDRAWTTAYVFIEECGTLDWYSLLGLYDTGCCTEGE